MENVAKGMEALKSHMIEDYNRWSGMCAKHDTASHSKSEIHKEMEEEYAAGLYYEVHTKYIKFMSASRGGGLCGKCFVVNTENDKKFRCGDILKPGGGMGPTRNFARGNILENDFSGVRWTGC